MTVFCTFNKVRRRTESEVTPSFTSNSSRQLLIAATRATPASQEKDFSYVQVLLSEVSYIQQHSLGFNQMDINDYFTNKVNFNVSYEHNFDVVTDFSSFILTCIHTTPACM